MTEDSATPTSVYRYYDRFGVLIYVGITKQGAVRNYQHNATQEWWSHVATQEVEHYPDRALAADRERELIRQHRPPFNKTHNIDWQELRAAYAAFLAVASRPIPAGKMPTRIPVLVVDGGRRMVTRLQDSAVVMKLAYEARIPVFRRDKQVGMCSARTAGALLHLTPAASAGYPRHDHGVLRLRTKSQKPHVMEAMRLTLCLCGNIGNHPGANA